MATPFLAGIAIAAAALAGRYGILAWHTFKTRPPKPRMRKFYNGGFQPTMTKREAALILGIRERYWLPTILMLVVAIIRLLKSMKLKM